MKKLLVLLVCLFCLVSATAAKVPYVLSAKTPGLSQAHWWNDWNSNYHFPPETYLIKEEGTPSFEYSSVRDDHDFFFIPTSNACGGKILALLPLQTQASYLAIAQEVVSFLDFETGRIIEVSIKTNGQTTTVVGPVAVYEGDFMLDGLQVFVRISCTSTPRYPKVQLTWGDRASPGNPGTDTHLCVEGVASPTRTAKFALEKDTPGLSDALKTSNARRYWNESEDVFIVKQEGAYSHAYSSIRKEKDFFFIPMNNTYGGTVLALSPLQTQNDFFVLANNVAQFTILSTSEAIAVPLIPKGATISSVGILSGYEGSFKVGALEIFVNVSSFSSPWHPQVQLTWGNGAAPGDTGSDIDTFTTDPVVKVVSPNGGETFVAGQKVTISYSTRNYPRPVKVAIQLNKGATYPNGPYNPVGVEGLATDYNLATGSYTWTIPLDMPAGSDYSLLISPDYPNTETPLGTAHSSSFTITAPASSGGGGGGGGVVVPVVPSEPPMVVDELSVPEVAEMSYFTLGEGFFCLVTFKSPVAVKGNQVEWSIPGAHFFVNEPDIFWGPGNTGMGFRLFNTSEFQGKSINELRNLLSKLTVGLRFFNLHR